MATKQKHTLIIISETKLFQRHLDYFCLDHLVKYFNLEFWDCSAILDGPQNHISSFIERPYVQEIKDLNDFECNLKRIPKDSLIVYFALRIKLKNIEDILSSYFRHIVFVTPILTWTLTKKSESDAGTQRENKNISWHKKIKSYLYQSKVIQVACQCIRHPLHAKSHIKHYIADKNQKILEWHYISCVSGSKHQINNYNVDKYMRTRHNPVDKPFVVYIDQFFPYHNELKFSGEDNDIDRMAKSHYKKLNAYFDKVEASYSSPVIIAAHPLAKYDINPFNGREIIYFQTDKLIAESKAVLMHSSTSITFAILNDKPVALLLDSEYQQSSWYKNLETIHEEFGIEIKNIDQDDASPLIPPVSTKQRKKFIEEYVGGIDEDNYVYNDVLLVKAFNDVYKEIYG